VGRAGVVVADPGGSVGWVGLAVAGPAASGSPALMRARATDPVPLRMPPALAVALARARSVELARTFSVPAVPVAPAASRARVELSTSASASTPPTPTRPTDKHPPSAPASVPAIDPTAATWPALTTAVPPLR